MSGGHLFSERDTYTFSTTFYAAQRLPKQNLQALLRDLRGLPPRYLMSIPLVKLFFLVPWYAQNLFAGLVLSVTPNHRIQSFNSSAQILLVLSV